MVWVQGWVRGVRVQGYWGPWDGWVWGGGGPGVDGYQRVGDGIGPAVGKGWEGGGDPGVGTGVQGWLGLVGVQGMDG